MSTQSQAGHDLDSLSDERKCIACRTQQTSLRCAVRRCQARTRPVLLHSRDGREFHGSKDLKRGQLRFPNGRNLHHALLSSANFTMCPPGDAPDTHHSTAMEWPMLLVGDLGGRLKLGGQYINYPGYGKLGHRTVGSFYSTLLHAAGAPQETFGRLDPDLDEVAMQTGPCPELLG